MEGKRRNPEQDPVEGAPDIVDHELSLSEPRDRPAEPKPREPTPDQPRETD